MLSPFNRSRIASIVLLALLLPMFSPLLAATRARTLVSSVEPEQEKKEKEKSEKPSKDEKKNLSKQERKWLEIYRFSKQLYETDPDFRMQVDEDFRRMQREHSDYAFSINMKDPRLTEYMTNPDARESYLTLYDNPLAQDYVNRVGQSLVPAGSDKLYAFKIMLNPVPEARSLSTGTIYVSTGLLASIDNEAQLAYVLGHEIAHVEKEHWKDDVLVAQGVEAWNEKQQQKKERIGLATKIGLGIATMGLSNAANIDGWSAALFANAAMPTILKLAMPNAVVSWDRQQEDQADEGALRYMLDRTYDPREIAKFYAKLKALSQRDKRASLGFIASATRVAEREPLLTSMILPMVANSASSMLITGAVTLNVREQVNQTVNSLLPPVERKPDTGKKLDPTENAAAREQAIQTAISGEYASRIKQLLESGGVIGSRAEFLSVMAAIRRDNGIRAFHYDMLQMARENLEESIRLRSSDPFAHYYYGKVLKLTARTLGEKQRALDEFALAIQLDKRKVLAEPYLYSALALIDNKESSTREIIENLKEYVLLYQRQHGGTLPSNIELIYDYMQDAGETSWTAIPAINVSTKNIDPIGVTGLSQGTTTSAVPTNPQPRPIPATQSPAKQTSKGRP